MIPKCTKITCWANYRFVPVSVPFGAPVSPSRLHEARQLKAELQDALQATKHLNLDPHLVTEAEIFLILMTRIVRWMETGS